MRSILRAARGWSAPPTLFMGDPRVTTYSYDTAGRVVRAETVEWTRRDFDMVMALEDYEAGLCSGCRTPLAETTKRENQFRYVGKMASVCHKCVALEVAMDNNHKHPGAVLYDAELRT